mmetsp:Transcript_14007/g.15986  ORF Transcript_14007/g.15986 Transcript_14007/m.15986 type:complete len:228 (+) Transcript_14007:359-1042(+)
MENSQFQSDGAFAYHALSNDQSADLKKGRSNQKKRNLLGDSESGSDNSENENSPKSYHSSSSRSSSQSANCRICGEGEIVGAGDDRRWQLISPCHCKGSLARVHVNCLEKWILTRPRTRNTGDILECEICTSRYGVSLVRKLRCDMEHICSWSTLAHFVEGCTLLLCIGCVFYILVALFPAVRTSSTSTSERALLIGFLTFLSLICLCALTRLFKRWHSQISVPSIV